MHNAHDMGCLCSCKCLYMLSETLMHALHSGCYSPSPLKEISSRNFGLLTISYKILGKPPLGNPRSPRWHLCHYDDSTQLCRFLPPSSWSLTPWCLLYSLVSLRTPGLPLSWYLGVWSFVQVLLDTFLIGTRGIPKRLNLTLQATVLSVFLPWGVTPTSEFVCVCLPFRMVMQDVHESLSWFEQVLTVLKYQI